MNEPETTTEETSDYTAQAVVALWNELPDHEKHRLVDDLFGPYLSSYIEVNADKVDKAVERIVSYQPMVESRLNDLEQRMNQSANIVNDLTAREQLRSNLVQAKREYDNIYGAYDQFLRLETRASATY